MLRTYPLKEADKIVSFFSRNMGKARGVARGARKPKSRYGASLEPLSHVRLWCFEKESSELLSIDNCELIQSYFDVQKDYAAGVALAYVAEVTEQLQPAGEKNDAFFRLLLLVLGEVQRTGEIWGPLTYFDLWTVRLGGFLPALASAKEVGEESRTLAAEMLARPLNALAPRAWTRETARDLRGFLSRQIENHVERRLTTRQALDTLD